MKVCSVTMAGRDTMPGDAIDSCRGTCDSFIVTRPGEIRDFAAARNDLLAKAHEEGFDWALMLDTDERIHATDDVRHHLKHTPHDVLMVRNADGTYEKERLFRLPARGKYVGPTHEAFIVEGGTRGTLPGITFTELPKTPEQLQVKLNRDRDILLGYVDEHPDDPRWWYYLGDTEANLGLLDDAITDFRWCYDRNGWDEESAWAAYRIAVIESSRGHYDEAMDWCLKGMTRRADFPEFPWLVGWCCYQMGRYEQAIYWSGLAHHAATIEKLSPRIGFRYPPAHHEGPYDVARWAYRALGLADMADISRVRFEQALRQRETAG